MPITLGMSADPEEEGQVDLPLQERAEEVRMETLEVRSSPRARTFWPRSLCLQR